MAQGREGRGRRQRRLTSIRGHEARVDQEENKVAGEREQRIRDRAYAIWEAEGYPDGKDLEHWLRAEAEIAAETRGGLEGRVVDPDP
jgi:hypothetical protein